MATTPGGTIPGAGQFLQQQLGYQRAWQEAQRQLGARQSSLQTQYGFSPQGAFTGDATSAFGMQNNNEGRQLQAADASIHSRGFDPNSGFGAQLEQPVRTATGAADAQLFNRYASALGSIADQRTTAYDRYQQGTVSALQAAVQQALHSRNFSPAALPKFITWQGQQFHKQSALAGYLKKNKLGPFAAWEVSHPKLAEQLLLMGKR